MTDTAIVKSIDGNDVTVVRKSEETCGGCSGLFCNAESHSITAKKTGSLDIHEGDLIDLYIPPGKTMFQGFIVLVLPLILFITLFIIGGKIIPEATEGIKVLFGLAGLASGFGASFLYGKKTRESSMPRVVGQHTNR